MEAPELEDWDIHHAIRNGVTPETLQYMLERHPDAANQRDNNGNHLVHTVVEAIRDPKIAIEMMEILNDEEAEYDWAHEWGHDGLTPYHRAVQCRSCPTEVLEWMLQKNPYGARVECHCHFVKILHLAIMESHVAAVRVILEQCPESIDIVGSKQMEYRTPLEMALDYTKDINAVSNQEIVRLLLQADPHAATVVFDECNDQLENAIRRGANRTILELLIEAYPDALHNPTILLKALKSYKGVDIECFSLLLEKCPVESLHTQIDLLLKVPRKEKKDIRALGNDLQLSMREWGNDKYGTGAKLISHLPIRKYPRLLRQEDKEWVPLHEAAASALASMDLVKTLMRFNPNALQTPDCHGRLPLHVLLAERPLDCSNDYFSILQLFLDEFPAGLTWMDKDGLSPLHVACMHGCDFQVIQKLVLAHPAAVQLRSLTGEIPLFLACQSSNADLNSILFLVQHFPDFFNHFRD